MDITEFFNLETGEIRSTETQKSLSLLENSKLTQTEKTFCREYLKNGALLKNGLKYSLIMKKVNTKFAQKHNIKELIQQLIKDRGEIITFTEERINVLTQILTMIYDDKSKTYGMYGYAGTGKTTLIMELVQFLITNKLIKKVAFTAPTHKALNIMKTNFSLLMKDVIDKLGFESSGNFENDLCALENSDISIDFLTIHKLLGYSLDFTNTGEKQFIKKQSLIKPKKQSQLNKYDLVFIDECSMIPIKIILDLLDEIKRSEETKIIFTGDPAQLPPVNEKSSSIFIKTKEDLSYQQFIKFIDDEYNFKNTQFMYDEFIKNISNIPVFTLKQIFRNNKKNVLDLCFNIRQWVVGDIKIPKLKKYAGNGVYFYKYNGGDKTKTAWFQHSLKSFTDDTRSNIILTWTNNCCDLYNNKLRQQLLHKQEISKYEVGDILILNDFYCFNSSDEEQDRFYTSEQIKIVKLEITTKTLSPLSDNVRRSIQNLKESKSIIKKYQSAINQINISTKRKYQVWKLTIVRVTNDINHDDKEYIMFVVHDSSLKLWTEDNEYVINSIKLLDQHYQKSHHQQLQTIQRNLIRPLWEYYNDNFVAPFASVIYGYSITTHKAQGSTFHNVYVDADDILNNTNESEAKRCIYTSHTRSANEIHILI